MATTVITKSSINAVSGGFNQRTTGGGSYNTVLTLQSNQYAIVTLFNMTVSGGASGTADARIAFGGNDMLQVTASTGGTGSIVQGVVAAGTGTAYSNASPITIYVGPSQVFQTYAALTGTGVVNISLSYTVFQNT